jgi:hypothetical protein
MLRCAYFLSEVVKVKNELDNGVEVAGLVKTGLLLPMFRRPAGKARGWVSVFLSHSR